MENKKKRPCHVKTKRFELTDEKRGWINVEYNGLFHEWGNEAVEAGETGFGNFTIGIVEDETGQIHTINPNHIKFTDR